MQLQYQNCDKSDTTFYFQYVTHFPSHAIYPSPTLNATKTKVIFKMISFKVLLHKAPVFLDGGSISGWVLRDLNSLFNGSQ